MKLLILTLSILMSASAMAAHHGKILTNKAGMTLYTFDKDSNGTSNCNGGCAQKWPPYAAKDGAYTKPGWTVIDRKDGSKQWAYNGQPLYTWVGDTKKGDTTGDGVGGVWHVAEKGKAQKNSANKEKVSGSPDY